MIVLHSKELIFLKTRKTAGTSFEIALSKFAEEDDILTGVGGDNQLRRDMGFRGAQNFKMTVPEMVRFPGRQLVKNIRRGQWPAKYFSHISAADVKKRLDPTVWSNFKKVAIVRNPYDYAVSSYFWAHKHTDKLPPFEAWCLRKAKIFKFNRQHYFVDGELIIDHFIRFEHFEQDSLEMERMFGLDGFFDTFREIKAKGTHRPKRATVGEMFKGADRLKALIQRECAFEIEKFGYQPPA